MRKQTEANKKWQKKNKEYASYLNGRSRARGFIRNQATLEDVQELRRLLDEREQQIKNSHLEDPAN